MIEYMKIFFAIMASVILLWTIASYFGSRVKEPEYTVLEKKDGYEIREYKPHIEAQVQVTGSYRESLNAGFRILAGYIFGGNTSRTPIAMTAPVVQKKSEVIAMTAPVIEKKGSVNKKVISFVMPAEYTIETLPTPSDKRVTLVEVPAHKSAVLRYSWYSNEQRSEAKKSRLLGYLKRDKTPTTSEVRNALYNQPWTMPFLLRNEVIVDVE